MTYATTQGNSEPRENDRYLTGTAASSKEALADDLHKIGRDLDELIEHSKTLTQTEFEAARRKFMDGLAQAKQESQRIGARVSEAGTQAVLYIRDHPWYAAGTALGVGVLVGMLIARR